MFADSEKDQQKGLEEINQQQLEKLEQFFLYKQNEDPKKNGEQAKEDLRNLYQTHNKKLYEKYGISSIGFLRYSESKEKGLVLVCKINQGGMQNLKQFYLKDMQSADYPKLFQAIDRAGKRYNLYLLSNSDYEILKKGELPEIMHETREIIRTAETAFNMDHTEYPEIDKEIRFINDIGSRIQILERQLSVKTNQP